MRKKDNGRPLIIDQRERDTIIAALRYWQRCGLGEFLPEMEIAENGRTGGDAALLPAEIDELIENRVNA